MPIKFYKYQGAGNDFIVIDNRDLQFERTNHERIAQWCDRRFGVGSDGLMLLENAEGYDFKMVYYNADGREGSMCGNGGRCIVAFAHDMGIIEDNTRFIAVDGEHEASLSKDGTWVRLKMIDVNSVAREGDDYVLNTGSPHYVRLVDDLDTYDVVKEGRKVRYNDVYKAEGINVNFVEPQGTGYAVRTYERGVEDETLACGTGVTAVAIAMAVDRGETGSLMVPVKARGGNLKVSFERSGTVFHDIFLEGPAQFVFAGEI
ncbi:diaminopimelate epimerase [Olivibacter sitiensis]|uniref:diaminopimelate epimerase n=1 Tax=Olivibacter sitiensis TaxID=376470 RepID=UPI0003FF1828|nr:diaminopimelate epimerase [Olivibacter sitiensis]